MPSVPAPLDRLFSRIDALEGEMVDFQKSITAIPALSPINGGSGEWDKAMHVKAWLESHGLSDIRQIDAPDPDAKNGVRPNLIVTIPGRSDDRTIWFMAHLDVVPEGDRKLWDSDPWQAEVRDGMIYGRGTEDNQQGVTSSVFVLRALVEEGVTPDYTVRVILAADEETGSGLGLDYLLEHHGDLFRPEDLVVVPDAGLPDSSMIEVAEKSIVWFRFRTLGKSCHGSEPQQGINAFDAASDLVVRLRQLYQLFDARDEVFAPPISTFAPTRKEANVPNVNTIPGEDIFYLDCRLLPAYAVTELEQAVRRICDGVERDFGVTIEITTTQRAEAAPPTAPDAPVVTGLQEGIATVYGVDAQPMGIGGGTVAAFFRRAGVPAAVWSTIEDVCHQPNEHCRIRSMVNDTKVFAHLCVRNAIRGT